MGRLKEKLIKNNEISRSVLTLTDKGSTKSVGEASTVQENK